MYHLSVHSNVPQKFKKLTQNSFVPMSVNKP